MPPLLFSPGRAQQVEFTEPRFSSVGVGYGMVGLTSLADFQRQEKRQQAQESGAPLPAQENSTEVSEMTPTSQHRMYAARFSIPATNSKSVLGSSEPPLKTRPLSPPCPDPPHPPRHHLDSLVW